MFKCENALARNLNEINTCSLKSSEKEKKTGSKQHTTRSKLNVYLKWWEMLLLKIIKAIYLIFVFQVVFSLNAFHWMRWIVDFNEFYWNLWVFASQENKVTKQCNVCYLWCNVKFSIVSTFSVSVSTKVIIILI